MTNEERRDFEQHKRQAEKQLSDMYFGNKGRGQSQENLRMPPFLSKAPGQNDSQKERRQPEKPAEDKNMQQDKPVANNFKPSNRGNLLELINFKNIKMDNDRLIILSLCLLLSNEQADDLLLLALIYIML